MRILAVILIFLMSGLNAGGLKAQKAPVKKTYNIALLLPFKSNETVSTAVADAIMDYYQGFKMAVKELEESGLKAKVFVFDTDKDSLALERLLTKRELKEMDVIIGPVYEDGMRKTEAFCIANQILLVSPLKYFEASKTGVTTINFFTSDSLRHASVMKNVFRMFPKHRFFIVSDGSSASKRNAGIIKKVCTELKAPNYRSVSIAAGKITPAITRTDSIILISTIESTDVKADLLAQIKNKKASWVLGHHEWLSTYKSVSNLNEPRLLYPEMTIKTPLDSGLRIFAERFYDNYMGDPSKYAYIGYDQGLFLGYGLMSFGTSFWSSTAGLDFKGLINHIQLSDCNGCNEINNSGLHFIRISEGTREEYEP